MTAFSPNTTIRTTLNDSLVFTTKTFGKINVLKNVLVGNNYQNNPKVHVRDFIISSNLDGSVTFSNSSPIIFGTNTSFLYDFSVGDYIHLRDETNNITDYRIITGISNNTFMTLDDNPYFNTNATSVMIYNTAVPALRANFSSVDVPSLLVSANGSINGENEKVIANPIFGTGIVKSVQSKNSGFGYQSGEYVSFAAYGAINDIQIINGGRNYSNGQSLVFSGGSATNSAQGKITTNANGTIVSVNYSKGSGYKTEPNVRIITTVGAGAVLKATIGGINNDFLVSGYINTGGSGKLRGYWTSTRGFLSSDKYLQDSYYYQEYSYEIQSSLSFDTYFSLMKKLFHTAGTEMFGRTVKKDSINSTASVVWEEVDDYNIDSTSTLDYSNENNSIYHYVLGT